MLLSQNIIVARGPILPQLHHVIGKISPKTSIDVIIIVAEQFRRIFEPCKQWDTAQYCTLMIKLMLSKCNRPTWVEPEFLSNVRFSDECNSFCPNYSTDLYMLGKGCVCILDLWIPYRSLWIVLKIKYTVFDCTKEYEEFYIIPGLVSDKWALQT